MKYNGPKARLVRRLGLNIFGSDKYDKILQRKPYGPGKSPRARKGRDSEYARQLKEKQKARSMYGLSESQFRRTYTESLRVKGQTGDMMKQLLERRLDNMIYRAGFATTRLQSRQFAGHGLFLVNGRRVTIPSIRVAVGDVIEVRPRAKSSPIFASIIDAHQKYRAPGWLKVDIAGMKIEVVSLPGPEDAEQAVDMRQIVEFYSR